MKNNAEDKPAKGPCCGKTDKRKTTAGQDLILRLSIKKEITDAEASDQTIREAVTDALMRTGIVEKIEFTGDPARVLSIDEIMVPVKQTDRVYIESRRNRTVLEPVFLWNPQRRRTGDEKRIRALGTLINDTLPLDAYNVDWRAWDKRPTEEERGKTPWEKADPGKK